VHVLSCSIFKSKYQAKLNICAIFRLGTTPNNADLAKEGLDQISFVIGDGKLDASKSYFFVRSRLVTNYTISE